MNDETQQKIFNVANKKIPFLLAVKYYDNQERCKKKLQLTNDEYDVLISKLFKYTLKLNKKPKKITENGNLSGNLSHEITNGNLSNGNKTDHISPPANGTINNKLLDRRFFSSANLTMVQPMRLAVPSQDNEMKIQNDFLNSRTFDLQNSQANIPIIDRNTTGTRMNDFSTKN